MDQSCLGKGPVAGCCEHGSEAFGSIKGKEFCNKLNNYQLLYKDSAPWCQLTMYCENKQYFYM